MECKLRSSPTNHRQTQFVADGQYPNSDHDQSAAERVNVAVQAQLMGKHEKDRSRQAGRGIDFFSKY